MPGPSTPSPLLQVAAQQPAATAQPAAFPRPVQHTGPVTALQLTERIRAKTTTPVGPEALDLIVAGDPTTAVTGIATTAMATFDCLRAAAAAQRNLVITLEPTFWSESDNLDRLEGDAAFAAKRDFIRANHLVCFHLRDHWPANQPHGIATGMTRALGWESMAIDAKDLTSFQLAPTTLLELAKQLATKLNDRTLRVVGDPTLPVSRVAAHWGNAAQLPAIGLLNSAADVVLVGYTHEWEAVEYAQDMISSGRKKGLILLGENASEQAGMQYCAEWLKTFITEVPVDFLPLKEPYWNLSSVSAMSR